MSTWILGRFSLYSRVCLLAAIFLSATTFAPFSIDTFSLVKLTLFWTLGMLALGFWILSCAETNKWPPRARLFVPGAAFVFFLYLSAIFSASPRFSLLGHYSRYGGALPYLTYALIALVIYGLFWEQPDRLGQVACVASAASIIVAGYVLIQAAGLDWHEWRNPTGGAPSSPTSTLGNSNFAGGYLATTLPLAFFAMINTRFRGHKIALSGLFALHVLALWYTQARGGMVGALAGAVIIAFCYRERLSVLAKAAIFFFLALLLAIAVIAIWHPGAEGPPEAVSEVRQLNSFSLETRFWYWAAAAQIFFEHPLVGSGPDSFLSYYPHYRLPKDGRVMGLNIPDKPHNVLLEHFSNEGLLGGGAYLATVAMGLWYGYQRSRQLGHQERLLLVCFTASLGAYLGQSFFSIDVPPLAAMGWIALGAIVTTADPGPLRARMLAESTSIDNVHSPKASLGAPASRRSILASQLTVFALLLSLIILGIRPLRADVKASGGRVYEAIALNPLEAEYNLRAADAARSVATSTRDPSLAIRFYERAERHYRRALSLQPGNILVMIKEATLYGIRAQSFEPAYIVTARRRWQEILDIDTNNRDVKTAYRSAKRAERRVIQQFEHFVRKHPQEILGWIELGKIYLNLERFGDADDALRQAIALDPANKVAQDLLRRIAERS